MAQEQSLWRAVRWPVAVVLLGLVGVGVATLLDEVFTSEWSLTIGAPSLWVLVIGAVWLAVAVVIHLVRRNRAT
ncbi:MAG TPA: hypothetical protein VFV67_30290 [Actinophytocola sp.]|uniref:hypothetical protein n=1 Tax=Actinophytocola sp. TaxID=1872138 RepID=UPI002DB7A9C1|nr:hypothetical protein [Actinophytocola sp.]HEU5474954.1 hypothetical protein [Actinophytocola sp.]